METSKFVSEILNKDVRAKEAPVTFNQDSRFMQIIQNIECKYEGDFKDGKLDGFGTIFNKEGKKWYEGELREGKLEGCGTIWN